MIKAVISDFSRVLLSPIDAGYAGGLNALQRELTAKGSYNFWEHFRLNQDLLAFYRDLRAQIGVYMFTSEYIQEHPELQPHLDGVFQRVFSGARLGLKKTDIASYTEIARSIGLLPQQILYVDDNEANCDAARSAGMVVVRFESNDQAIERIREALRSAA